MRSERTYPSIAHRLEGGQSFQARQAKEIGSSLVLSLFDFCVFGCSSFKVVRKVDNGGTNKCTGSVPLTGILVVRNGEDRAT